MKKNYTIIPFEEELRLEKQHTAEERKITRSIDWLDVFPEALSVIKEKIQEYLSDAQKITSQRDQHVQLITQESAGEERQIRMYLCQAFYNSVIDEIYQQIFRLTGEVKKHKGLTQPSYSSASPISAQDIETARSVSLLTLIERDGHQLRRAGKNWTTQCCFHEDKSPSLVIYPESNRFHCFSCQAHGDGIKYLMDSCKLNFIDAILYLKGNYA